MDDALNALDSNKGDPTESFRRILSSSETKFDAVRKALNAVAQAMAKHKILDKPAHLIKYVKMVGIIAGNRVHIEHTNSSEWSVLTEFLVVAYSHLRDALLGFEFTKAMNEVFRAWSLLLDVRECVVPSLLDGILQSCTDFVNEQGKRETSCHPFIMKVVRLLVEFEYIEANELGNQLLRMERVRNPMLIYEMFTYACFVPQPLDVLQGIEPQKAIESHEIEFVPSSEMGIAWFRPSSEADLTKFVAARAFSLAIKDTGDADYAEELPLTSHEVSGLQTPPTKRIKKESSDVEQLRFMAKAFQGGVEQDYLPVLNWVRSTNRQQSTGDTLRHSFNSFTTLADASFTSTSSRTADSTTKFWAFVLLGGSMGFMKTEEQLQLWNSCTECLQDEATSSAACFCLAHLVGALLSPAKISSQIVEKVKLLLIKMSTTPFPHLSSGSLVLYSRLHAIHILDDKFHAFKREQLREWVRIKCQDGPARLLTHLFADNCEPAYLEGEVAEQLKRCVEFMRIKQARSQASRSDLPGNEVGDIVLRTHAPLLSSFPQILAKNHGESLWILSVIAATNQKVPLSANQEADAFTESDLRAFVWFAQLAAALQWDEKYCRHALSLARWEIPARQHVSVSRAISLLQRPSAVVTALIAGYLPPFSNWGDQPGFHLRAAEPFLQSYAFQRSSYILQNLVKLIGNPVFDGTKEKQQLTLFLKRVLQSQSPFAVTKGAFCLNDLASSDTEFREIFEKMSRQQQFAVLARYSRPISWYDDLYGLFGDNVADCIVAGLFMARAGSITLPQLLVCLSKLKLDESQKAGICAYLQCDYDFPNLVLMSAASLYFLTDGPKLKTILSHFDAPPQAIERIGLVFEPLQTIDTTRSDEFLAGVSEQVLKECAYTAGPVEAERAVIATYTFLSAHQSKLSDNLWTKFFLDASALLSSSSISPGVLSFIESFIDASVTRSPQALSVIAVCLNKLRLPDLALNVISRVSNSASGLPRLLKLATEPKALIDEFEKVLKLDSSVTYELCDFVFHQCVSAVNESNWQEWFDALLLLSRKAAQGLLAWTNYLVLPESTYWASLMGKLASAKNLSRPSKVVLMDSVYGDVLSWTIENSSSTISAGGLNAFIEVMLRTYNVIPYEKKWHLHTFMLRSSLTGSRTQLSIADIFGPANWSIEVEYRPLTIHPELDRATKIAKFALLLLDLPLVGSELFRQVPELLQHVLPFLVAACYHNSNLRIQSSKRQEKANCRTLLEQYIRESLTVGGEESEIALRILKTSYELNRKLPVSLAEAVKACRKQETSLEIVELGILFSELIWNDNQHVLPADILEDLRLFYQRLPDTALKSAIPPSTSSEQYVSLINRLRSDEDLGPWQKLEFGLINNEVERSFRSSPRDLDETFQSAGLWHIANQITNQPDFYDLERAWWLHEWDAVQTNLDDNFASVFNKPEYGSLIRFFTGILNEQQTYAELSRLSIPMVSVFEHILSPHSAPQISNSVVRHGREILFTQRRNTDSLATELQQSCRYYRHHGEINTSIAFAVKLENLARDTVVPSIRSTSIFEAAKCEWAVGRHSRAIATLKALVTNSDDENINLASIYSTIGTWSREARNEPDNDILQNYFLKASDLADSTSRSHIFHAFAVFCDAASHDESLDTAIEDSARVKENEKRQRDYLAQAIHNGNTDKAFQSKYRMSVRLLKSETEDYEMLKQRKLELTKRCIQNYLLSLQYGDTYDEDMARFISLWLELWESQEVNDVVLSQIGEVPLWKYLPWINQLSSRLGTQGESTGFQEALQSIILGSITHHPHHAIWNLINILRTRSNSDKFSADRKSAAKRLVSRSSNNSKDASFLILNMVHFAEKMVNLASEKPSSDSKTISLRSLGATTANWWTTKLPRLALPVPTATLDVNKAGDYHQVPTIVSVDGEIDIAGGISAPKIVTLTDTLGSTHRMVLKASEKDDLRQDAIMQQVFRIANQLLPHSRVRTYNVIPLGGVGGAIEFVKSTKSLQEILEPLHTLHGGRQEYSVRKARHAMHAKKDCNRAIRISTFEDVMAHTPPQMRHYWPKRFSSPHSWLTAKTNWCRSTGVASIVGFVLGLGDRHCSNLLVDTNTGEVVHIDLGIAFDQAKQLYVPETVPFRLTRDMVDGMGVPGTRGGFMSAAELTMQAMRDQKERVLTVLEVLKHDALYTWRLPPLRLNRIQVTENSAVDAVPQAPRLETGQAEHALRGVRQKLTANLSCEAMVRDLVSQATDTNNLALIFSGWSPFY